MLENVTKDKRVSIRVIFLRGLKDKSLGAINQDPTVALLLETRFGIHTFWLNRPLDVLVLDKKGKIVKLKEKLKPNRVFFWNPKYSFILETPEGSIKNLNLENGNILRFSL